MNTMHFSLKPFFVKAALIGLFLYSALSSAASFGYLYIESSEGNSSGGHSAIQFGDEIYHYQHHDSGLIRLLRQDKQEFHFLYRFLQNRRIHLSQIDVTEETFTGLKEYFKLQFLAQDQQLKQLNSLHKDRLLLRHLLYQQNPDDDFLDAGFSAVLQLNGVGLFYAGQELDNQKNDWRTRKVSGVQSQSSNAIEMLRKKIGQAYGQDYLSNRREEITAQIKVLMPGRWPESKTILSTDNFPPAINSFADSYTDYLTGLAAIKVLMEGKPLRTDAFFITRESVSPEEKKVLVRLRDQLALSFLKSVNSGRPDWGYAVLVNMARFIAIDLSLQEGQWVFIDDFAQDSEWVSADQFARHGEQMHVQIKDSLANYIQSRKAVLNPEGSPEANYSKLEMSANRYFELLKGKQNKAIRYIGEKALPTKSISLPDWTAPQLTQQQIKRALSELDDYEGKLLKELTERYRYNLITRNCVTELFRTIDQSLLQQRKAGIDPSKQEELLREESTERLGGAISASYNFIPFVSSQSVQSHYNVTKSELLNSYRSQQLEKLSTRSEGMMSALRESNTFTSTLYDYNPDDAFFVFFTDDNLVLRPIFGAFNTAAGIGQSLFGFLSWPFDAGRNLKSGATGILMSLPELVFFNMRKGSYKYLSYNQFVNDEKSNN
ncbi:MAG: hypothetical protein PHO08_00960 [Methylococcales bacterium]|nr:hypothetical protein [Methylococcales bacterium]MDD5631631.1 hypothetical protein [Methylococcales bacterium]